MNDVTNIIPTPTTENRGATRVYLAGKIVPGGGWRDKLWRNDEGDAIDEGDRERPFSFHHTSEALDPNASALLSVTGYHDVEIIGPFFVSCDHSCAHSRQTHAVAGGCIDGGLGLAERDEIQKRVHAVNVARIERADFVFAHIDEIDCFGTIAEIGFAHGAGVPVHLHFGDRLSQAQRYDFWFVEKFAVTVHERITIPHAFARALHAYQQTEIRRLHGRIFGVR